MALTFSALHRSIKPLESRIAPDFSGVLNLAELTGANGFRIDGLSDAEQSGYRVGVAGEVVVRELA